MICKDRGTEFGALSSVRFALNIFGKSLKMKKKNKQNIRRKHFLISEKCLGNILWVHALHLGQN